MPSVIKVGAGVRRAIRKAITLGLSKPLAVCMFLALLPFADAGAADLDLYTGTWNGAEFEKLLDTKFVGKVGLTLKISRQGGRLIIVIPEINAKFSPGQLNGAALVTSGVAFPARSRGIEKTVKLSIRFFLQRPI